MSSVEGEYEYVRPILNELQVFTNNFKIYITMFLIYNNHLRVDAYDP